MLTDPGEERGAHVGAGVGDGLRVAAVLSQVGGETGHRSRVTALGGEQHPPTHHVGEDADIVLAFACRGLVHADLGHGREVLLVAGGPHVVFEHPPDPGVVLTGQLRDLGHRHDLGEGQRQRLETAS